MSIAKWVAIGLCVLFVLSAYAVWNYSFTKFNPNPVSTTLSSTNACSAPSTCGVFRMTSANLTIREAEGIVSQVLSLRIDNVGEVPMSSLEVFIDNVSVGSVSGPFAPHADRVVTLGVPTTITIDQGQTYGVFAVGTFPGQAQGQPVTDYTQSIQVVAG